jgi:hypothetical protein
VIAFLKREAKRINAYLEELYARAPGCCASGGLSVAQLNGERDRRREPEFPTDDWEFVDYRTTRQPD